MTRADYISARAAGWCWSTGAAGTPIWCRAGAGAGAGASCATTAVQNSGRFSVYDRHHIAARVSHVPVKQVPECFRFNAEVKIANYAIGRADLST